MSAGPCERSMRLLRDRGYLVAKCEHWNQFAGRRVDLFGVLDLVCLRAGETLGVQTTSASNVAARITKMRETPATALMQECGWKLAVHGWRKRKGRWICREVEL